MSGGSRTQLFRLVGPHAGKTMAVNGHEFVDGECSIHGNDEQIKHVANVFACYAAFTPEAIEAMELEAAVAPDPEAIGGEKSPQAPPVGSPKPSLAEAIGQLDPENDAHWTAQGLPAMDAIENIMGSKSVTRADVNAAADGYTRDKAKALRG